jgi:hypothetical protein
MTGGIAPVISKILKKEGKYVCTPSPSSKSLSSSCVDAYVVVVLAAPNVSSYQRFYDVVDREWSRVFPSLAGESLAFALPRTTIPTAPLGDFTQCQTPRMYGR